jgi:hypothetical protein
MRFNDYYNYLTKGDSYIKSKICKVDAVTYATLPNIVFASENIFCDDGKAYYLRYQHTYWRIAKKGKTFKITYLPKSRVILKMQ